MPPSDHQALRDALARILTPALTVEIGLTPHICPVCGITFAIPTYFDEACHFNNRPIRCPNGHKLVNTNSFDELIELALQEHPPP